MFHISFKNGIQNRVFRKAIGIFLIGTQFGGGGFGEGVFRNGGLAGR